MLLIAQVRDIEFVAVEGRAAASLLGQSCSLEECSTEKTGLVVYALECYFSEILQSLGPVNTGPSPLILTLTATNHASSAWRQRIW